ncbi:hypothetical protein RDWZM_008550 [Blomia tropicalis]|uniref:adenylate kinase n=1 Tax=Blomia tropicalis TaxID=40697 RepID=A0A9Q0M2A7_BLOTA|nr:hypothetical protein RDWZM_008550 [Blomia tropicalis]
MYFSSRTRVDVMTPQMWHHHDDCWLFIKSNEPIKVTPKTNNSSQKLNKSKKKMAPIENSNKKPIIFIIGGPGSGKGTICDQIKTKYGFTHLSTGDLLREEVASGSEKGKALNEVMVAGKLVSNDQVLDLLQSAIEKRTATSSGFLIDGYPREVGQAVDFEQKVCPCTVIFYFKCSDEEMTRRLVNRGKTSGRADDNVETIKKRLVTFHTHTQPILEHFASKLETIDTERSVDIIFQEVELILKKFLSS